MLHNGQMLDVYRIESMLGRGAMGVVYRAVDTRNDQPVAIKVLRIELLTEQERQIMMARFWQEARLGMRLRHPGIVRIHAHGEHSDVVYLVMELIAGQELGKLLKQQPQLSLDIRLALVLQLLDALSHAHEQQVIHRDVKLSNVLVQPDYRVVLTDFGIARVADSEMTQTGNLLGSPQYMAPEQLRAETVDHRIDLFSTGVVLYCLLTKRRPFTGDSLAALMQKVLHHEPLPPSTINPALPVAFDAVVKQAIAKDREQRFASALEFADALRQASCSESIAIPEKTVGSSPKQSTVSIQEPDACFESIRVLIQDCLAERATVQRLKRLQLYLEPGLDMTRDIWVHLCASAEIETLMTRIEHDAPLPGRMLQQARGDWLELVRLFAQLCHAMQPLNPSSSLEQASTRLIRVWSGACLNYAAPLNRLLFREDNPHLTQISADFMRLELLQLALEELGAESEAQNVQNTLLLFTHQVMSKVNALIQQFLESHDPLARFGVVNLLVEVEELIVLAERLLKGRENGMELLDSGGEVVAEFIENARTLSRMLGQELVERMDAEQQTIQSGQEILNPQQITFIGWLRQLGLLYRFVIRLEMNDQADLLGHFSAEVYLFLEHITDTLLSLLSAMDTSSVETLEVVWVRLTVIAELADQFGWLELRQRILLAASGRLGK